jgi:hypothetical protein
MSKAKRSIVYSLLIQIQLRSTASSYFLFFRVSQYQVISILFFFFSSSFYYYHLSLSLFLVSHFHKLYNNKRFSLFAFELVFGFSLKNLLTE